MFAVKRITETMLFQNRAWWVASHNLYVRTDTALANREHALRISNMKADTGMALYNGCQKSYDDLARKSKKKTFWRFLEGTAVGIAAAIVIQQATR